MRPSAISPPRVIVVLGMLGCCVAQAAAGGPVAVVVDRPLRGAAGLALGDLEQMLRAKGLEAARRDSLGDEPLTIVVGIAGQSELVDNLLKHHAVGLSDQAESLCVRRWNVGGRAVLLVAGRDERGLSYALLDVARDVELSPNSGKALEEIHDVGEAPFLRVRNISVHPQNGDVDAEWYFDESFWRAYFLLLARSRFNTFTLTFCDQTNYFNPIYAYLVDVPGFEQVRVDGLTADARARNLAMLGRIAALARERGLDFTLGVWMQAPIPRYSGKVLATHLPEGPAAAQYAARGLAMILAACPNINGLQLRMNDEAGVPPEQQTDFYRPMFRVLSQCGRPIPLELRYKGLTQETIHAAKELGLDVTVSTKFWCEHFGLPYHPTSVDTHYRESRYSFGAILAQPRPYRVAYQLWTVGSQRLLLWGDPDYAARFARSCRLGGGEAFEVFAPLTNKGYGNASGLWPIFADRTYAVGRWEYERYWFFYLAFGRLGYNPETHPDVWRRELRHRFGEAADDLEAAYRHASQIIPLVTAARQPGASEWGWWPEMDTGGALPEYIRTQPGDPAQFYAIRSWQRTPAWRWEDWDATPGFVDDAVAGTLHGKTTPLDVSRRLRRFAETTNAALDRAQRKLPKPREPEFKSTELDLRVLAQLALYHAEKTSAATHLAFFDTTGEPARLTEALRHIHESAHAWQRVVALTERVYHDNLVFGLSPDSPRSKLGHHHTGDWKDRLPEVGQDVAYLESLVRKHGQPRTPYRRYPGESPAETAPEVQHSPPAGATPGVDLVISGRVVNPASPRQIVIHYRPLDQTADWRRVPIRPTPDGSFQAVIPGRDIASRFDLQYYLEVLTDSDAWLWPSWDVRPPYVVVERAGGPDGSQPARTPIPLK